MNRPARTLSLLVVFALGGVVALGMMAQRYARLLPGEEMDGRPAAVPERLARVDAFVQVRAAMRRVVDEAGGEPEAGRLQRARDRALAAAGFDPDDYRRLRGQYRAWRSGRQALARPMVGALDARRARLDRVDLGAYERLDR